MDCDTCLRLWTEYARACRIRGEIRTPETILAEIEKHEAADHADTIPARKKAGSLRYLTASG